MSEPKSLPEIVREIQREVGVKVDGIAGLVTMNNVLAALQARHMEPHEEPVKPPTTAEATVFDARSEQVLATLDPKAQPKFRRYLALAQATAASYGCQYRLLSGNRTYAEQDALYEQGRSKPGPKVTNARGGQSDHNFGIATDGGIFQGGTYLDGGTPAQQALASKIHKACSLHAESCDLEWGGNWKSIKDEAHMQVKTGLSLAQMRSLMKEKGSVL